MNNGMDDTTTGWGIEKNLHNYTVRRDHIFYNPLNTNANKEIAFIYFCV